MAHDTLVSHEESQGIEKNRLLQRDLFLTLEVEKSTMLSNIFFMHKLAPEEDRVVSKRRGETDTLCLGDLRLFVGLLKSVPSKKRGVKP